MLSFKAFLRKIALPYLDEVFVTSDGQEVRFLAEGKWVSGRFENNIRIDRATHLLSGDQHAHIYGRKGSLVGVLNFDGTLSQGGEAFRLHKSDATALRRLGCSVPESNIIEWIVFDTSRRTQLVD